MNSVNRMASIHRRMGNLAEALPLFEEDLRGARRILGDEHSDTLLSMHALGNARCEHFDFGTGLPLMREAVAGHRKVLGEAHPETQECIATLAKFEHEQAVAKAAREQAEGGEKRKRRRKQ